MGKALFELSWALRHHDEAAVRCAATAVLSPLPIPLLICCVPVQRSQVRRGALVALAAVGRATLPAVLLADFEDSLPELQEWLRATAEHDTDHGCQQLAVASHTIFGQAVQSETRLAPI